MKKKVLDKRVLIVTLISGIAGAAVNLLLYNSLANTMGKPLLIALMMSVFSLIMGVSVTVTVMVCDATSDELWFMDSRLLLVIGMAVALVAVFLSGMFLEWLYDHSEIKSDTGDAYIFILDESGSMSSNDPSNERYRAVNEVMHALPEDFPYMVYMFDEECVKIREFMSRSSGDVVRPANASTRMGGLTYISGALTAVYQDIINGAIGTNVTPHVILMTDGHANDMGMLLGKGILKDYKRSGIRISAVGLGSVDQNLMQEIADKTGGTFILVNDASQLLQGFSTVTSNNAQRDLLSVRNLIERDGLYMLLRILFLTVIGAVIALLKGIACGEEDSFLWIMAFGVGSAFLGALIIEFGLKLGIPRGICHFLFWILLSITPHFVYETSSSISTGSIYISHNSVKRKNSHTEQRNTSTSRDRSGGHRNVKW